MILPNDPSCVLLAVEGAVEHAKQSERIALEASSTRRCDIGSLASLANNASAHRVNV